MKSTQDKVFEVNGLRATILSLGELSCPGAAIYGGYSGWESFHTPDEHGLVRFPTRALLLELEERVVLVDCGYGVDFSEGLKAEFALTREPFLQRAVSVEQITDVVFTHSHFDHIAGAVDGGKPTFSNAVYHIQKASWNDSPDPEWNSIVESQVNLLEGDIELYQGLELMVTGGHSTGHQAVLAGGLLFAADICPTRLHQKLDCIMTYDIEPAATRKAKEQLLVAGRTLIFSHDPEVAFVEL